MLKRSLVKGLCVLSISTVMLGGNVKVTNASTIRNMITNNITTNSSSYSIEDRAEEIKYIVLFEDESYTSNTTACSVFEDRAKREILYSPTVFIDDSMVIDALDYFEEESSNSKLNINNNNSIMVYFPVNEGIDYHRAIANFILYYRDELKDKFPNAEIITKTEAMKIDDIDVMGVNTNPNKILNANSSWWTLDKILELCSNDELIPFIDYSPVEEKYREFKMNAEDFMEIEWKKGVKYTSIKKSLPRFEGTTIRESINSQVVEYFNNYKSVEEVEEDTNNNFFDKIKNLFKK